MQVCRLATGAVINLKKLSIATFNILVSQEFYDNSKKRLWMFDGLVINNDHLNFDDHKSDGTNDHSIIRATFEHRPIKKDATDIVNG